MVSSTVISKPSASYISTCRPARRSLSSKVAKIDGRPVVGPTRHRTYPFLLDVVDRVILTIDVYTMVGRMYGVGAQVTWNHIWGYKRIYQKLRRRASVIFNVWILPREICRRFQTNHEREL